MLFNNFVDVLAYMARVKMLVYLISSEALSLTRDQSSVVSMDKRYTFGVDPLYIHMQKAWIDAANVLLVVHRR